MGSSSSSSETRDSHPTTRRRLFTGGAVALGAVGAGLGGGSSLAQTTPVEEPWVRRDRAPHNVKDYGAVGDGNADDTAAIQEALDAGAGGVVFFPPSAAFYKVTSPIVIPSNTVVDGVFGGAFSGEAVGVVTIKKTNGDTGGNAVFTLGDHCLIRGINFMGPTNVAYYATSYPADHANPSFGCYGTQVSGCQFERCRFYNFAQAGIGGSLSLASARDCYFAQNLYGINWAAADSNVENCFFHHNVATGFRTSRNYNRLVNCRLEWNGRYGASFAGGEATVVANVFDRNGWSGLYMEGGAWGYLVTGNYFSRNAAGGDGSAGRWEWSTPTHPSYLAPPTEYDKSHIRLHYAKYGTITGNRFRAGFDDAGAGARAPKYVYAASACDNVVIGLNQDASGWQPQYGDGPGAMTHTDPTNTWLSLLTAADRQLKTNGYLELQRIPEPGAPSAGLGRLYLRDSGSGKTQLCVRTSSGAHVVWTEP